MTDPVYSFDVAVSSHELLKQHILEHRVVCVAVAAPNRNKAAEIACQMAARHGMPTAVRDRPRPQPTPQRRTDPCPETR